MTSEVAMTTSVGGEPAAVSEPVLAEVVEVDEVARPTRDEFAASVPFIPGVTKACVLATALRNYDEGNV